MTPDELRARRETLGLTQSDLARALGVPRLTVWKWEHARQKVPTLMDMAIRGVSATLLLDLSETEWVNPQRLHELGLTKRRRRARAERAHGTRSNHSAGSESAG